MGLFSGIIKGIFGGNKKDNKTTTSGTSDYNPWDVVIPSLQGYLDQTNKLYATTPGISDYEQQGYDQLAKLTDGPATALDPAIAENNKTLSGYYLNPETNPYIKDIASRMGGIAGATSNASFSGAGRTGSGLAGYYSGKGAADAAGEVYNSNYQNERGRMGAAVGMAPGLEQGRYLAPQARLSAGQNISARPFDINEKYGSILASLGGLGQQGSTTGQSQGYHYQGGLIGKIADSFTNKLFPGG